MVLEWLLIKELGRLLIEVLGRLLMDVLGGGVVDGCVKVVVDERFWVGC